MRAVVVRSIGGPEVLGLEEVEPPGAPAAGEALVRIEAVGVNYADTERRRGVYSPPPLPWIPGREAAGVVVDVGPGVDRGVVGACVAFYSNQSSGTYAESALVPASALFRFEDETPFETMAALPAQGLTAHGVLRLAGPAHGRTALVLAAAGGVGQILAQLALRAGIRVIGAVSAAAKEPAVASLGAEVIVGYANLAAEARARTDGRGVDLVFDSLGRATQGESLGALARYGQLVFYGDSSGLPEPIDIDALYERSLRVGAFGLDIERDPEGLEAARRDLLGALSSGALRIAPPRAYPLAEAAAAHAAIESRETTGKIVLNP
ncbi:MAG: zinc-binding dehydrogenase [Hyphomicrobiales bacterium]